MDCLIDYPQLRRPPAALLGDLRATDSTAELLYLGDGSWVLGRVRPSRERLTQGRTMIENAWLDARKAAFDEAEWYARQRFANAVAQGFAPIKAYPSLQGEPDGRILRDFRRAVWGAEHDTSGQDLKRRLKAAEKDPAGAMSKSLEDMSLHNEAARIMRNPVSFTRRGTPT